MSGGGSSGQTNTNTQVEQIPAFEQQSSENNQNIAASIASTPYPTYNGQLIADFTPQQTQGMSMAGQAATAYQPDLNTAQNMTAASTQPWNTQSAEQYMSPYAQAALAPQIEAEQMGLGQQQMATNASATEAGAFGDARNGVANSLNNFYGDQSLANIEATGMNSAYTTGLGAYQTAQGQLQSAAGQMGTDAGLQQSLGETGAGSLYNAGTQQQELNQQQLTESYNNFLNQTNWANTMLGVTESALSNSPYDMTGYTSLAPSNAAASNLGAFSSLAGLLGGGSSGSTTPSIFGASSDIRLKKDIKLIGHLPSGIPFYEFKYKNSDKLTVGIMAQEILSTFPDAVSIDDEGYYRVDYSKVN